MLTYAHVCSRMLAYDHECSLTYARVCSRMLTYARVCSRMVRSRRSPAYADGATVLSLRPPMEAGSDKANANSKHVFVLSFPGDVTASQVLLCSFEASYTSS